MGSVLSSAYAALCSFVNAQLDKMEERRLMASFPQLRNMPAKEREKSLRWLKELDEEHTDSESDDDMDGWQDVRCKTGNKNT